MKIAYISNSIIPSRSANSLQVMKMCEAFEKNGHEVILFAPERTKEYEKKVANVFDYYGVDECFEIKKLPYPSIKGKRQIFALLMANALMKIKPDLAYGRFIFGCYYAAKLGYETMFESHIPMQYRNKLERFYIRELVKSKKFKRLVVISQAQKEMYLEEGILTDEKIRVARSGAKEVKDFQKLRSWPSRNGALQVGYVGHLYKGKGPELIVNISKHLPNTDFHVIGGMEEDIAYWKKQVNNDNVYFHGHIAPSEVYRYRNSCDILCAPYQKRVFVYGGRRKDVSRYMSPIKLFEYMASKKAIIASNLPVIREMLKEKNAILADPESATDLVNAIDKLRDENLREKL